MDRQSCASRSTCQRCTSARSVVELVPQQHRAYVAFVFFIGVKNGWKFAWQTMMKELAPQTADGSYSRPSYDFQAKIGDANFPVSFLHCVNHTS